jgi:hypothetical protein
MLSGYGLFTYTNQKQLLIILKIDHINSSNYILWYDGWKSE